MRDNVFENGPINIWERQPLQNLKWQYGLFEHISLSIFKDCLPQYLIWSIREQIVPYIVFYNQNLLCLRTLGRNVKTVATFAPGKNWQIY